MHEKETIVIVFFNSAYKSKAALTSFREVNLEYNQIF